MNYRSIRREISLELSSKSRGNKEQNSCILLALLLHNTVWKEFLSNSHSSLNNAEIHSNLSEITISEPTQRHDNYAKQLVTDCNGDDG